MFDQMEASAEGAWANASSTIPGVYYWTSGEAPEASRWDPFDPSRGLLRPPPMHPRTIDPTYVADAVEAFTRTGFHSPLNSYRAIEPFRAPMGCVRQERGSSGGHVSRRHRRWSQPRHATERFGAAKRSGRSAELRHVGGSRPLAAARGTGRHVGGVTRVSTRFVRDVQFTRGALPRRFSERTWRPSFEINERAAARMRALRSRDRTRSGRRSRTGSARRGRACARGLPRARDAPTRARARRVRRSRV